MGRLTKKIVQLYNSYMVFWCFLLGNTYATCMEGASSARETVNKFL